MSALHHGFRVRRAGPQDAGLLGEVEARAWRETYSGLLPIKQSEPVDARRAAIRWRGMLRRAEAHPSDEAALLLQKQDETFGYASAGPQRFRRHNGDYPGEVYALYVLRDAQGAGGGRELLRACARTMAVRGFFSFTVWALASNSAARAFYERMGGVALDKRWTRESGRRVPLVCYAWGDVGELIEINA